MEPDDRGSVTIWIDAVCAGDQEAARQLWQRYFEMQKRLEGLEVIRKAWLDEALP